MKNLSKNSIIIFLITCFFTFKISAQFDWNQLNTSSAAISSTNFYDVQFLDPYTGYICGSYGSVIKTTDGGISWTNMDLPVSAATYVNNLFFLTKDVGWVSCSGGKIFKTENGGNTWIDQSPVSSIMDFIISIHFLNENIGFVSASTATGDLILKTNNGGNTWTELYNFPSVYINSIKFANENVGYASTQSGIVYKTINGGINWTMITTPYPTTSKEAIYLFSENKLTIVGDYGMILYSNNGGDTWIDQSVGTSYAFIGVDFYDENNGLAVGESGNVYKTSNGGSTWTQETFFSNSFIFWGVHYFYENFACVVGGGGGTTSPVFKSPYPNNDIYIENLITDNNVCKNQDFDLEVNVKNISSYPVNYSEYVVYVNDDLYTQTNYESSIAQNSNEILSIAVLNISENSTIRIEINGDSITSNNTFIQNFIVHDAPEYSLSGPHEICYNQNVEIYVESSNDFIWLDDWEDPYRYNQTFLVNSSENYYISVYNDFCSILDSVIVDVNVDCSNVITAFSPNNDGVNDFLIIDEISGFENTVKIFNRWGDEIISFKDYDNVSVVWDGTNQFGENLTSGTYFIIYEAPSQNIFQSNWVQIVR